MKVTHSMALTAVRKYQPSYVDKSKVFLMKTGKGKYYPVLVSVGDNRQYIQTQRLGSSGTLTQIYNRYRSASKHPGQRMTIRKKKVKR